MQNAKPQRKNQDSAGCMDNMFLRDLLAQIANTYGASFMQTYIVRQLSKVFDKLTFFCKTKPIYVRPKLTQALL